jgi:putative ATP-binding cassette transporter
MTAPADLTATPLPGGLDRATAMSFRRIARGYWRGDTARSAWFWSSMLAFCLVLKLVVDVAVNQWNRWFFDALERRDPAGVGWSILVFALIMLALAAVGASIVRARETLQVGWRAWLTGRLLDDWIKNQRFFRMSKAAGGIANPEYRISDDVRLATEPLVDFAIGMFTALLSASTFVGILWSVGGSLTLETGGGAFTIPAYMVFAAIAYGVTTSTLVPIIGRRLPMATAARNESEALFRAETIHLRENAESIALTRAESFARGKLDETYVALLRNWMAMVRQHVNVTWIMNANTAMIPVVPLLLATPKYLSGDLSLGQVIQLASAFTQVQYAIGWLAENYRNVAEWSASARRVVELDAALTALDMDTDAAPRFDAGLTADEAIIARNLTLCDPAGRAILADINARIEPGDRILVRGPSGSGKSVLARALSGFWVWGHGRLFLPKGATPILLTPAPFLPEGTLAAAILCPAPADSHNDLEIAAALEQAGATHLIRRLRETSRWTRTLSPSDKQRCAIARTLLQRPPVILIEDALSACDADTQARLTEALFARCERSLILDFSNRPPAPELYNRHFNLIAEEGRPSHLVESASERARIDLDAPAGADTGATNMAKT